MAGSGGHLEGRVAIITGAGQGIGAAIALAYASAGAKVLITGRTQSKLEEVTAKIKAEGGAARWLAALAGNREQARKTVDEAISAWGRVDVLVNNAHTFTDYLPIEDPKLEDNIRIDMDSAFIGSLQLMQCVFPHMRTPAAARSSTWGRATASVANPVSWPTLPRRRLSGP